MNLVPYSTIKKNSHYLLGYILVFISNKEITPHMKQTVIRIFTLILAAPFAQAATLTILNGDFEANTWTSSGAPTSWTSVGGGNYGNNNIPELQPSTVAFMQSKDGNYYQQGMTAYDEGVVDATTFSSYSVAFDYGYRRDSATNGDLTMRVSLWDTTNDLELAGEDLIILEGLGVGDNSSTAKVIDLFYDNGAQTGGDGIAVRFTHVGDNRTPGGLDWHSTAYIDNVAITAVPEPASAALLGLGGLALILHRRKSSIDQ